MGPFGTGGDEEQGRGSDVVVDVVVVVLGNWKIAENPKFEEIKGGTCAESVQHLRGVLADVVGRFGAGGDIDKVAGASDVVVDVVLVVLWKWKNE